MKGAGEYFVGRCKSHIRLRTVTGYRLLCCLRSLLLLLLLFVLLSSLSGVNRAPGVAAVVGVVGVVAVSFVRRQVATRVAPLGGECTPPAAIGRRRTYLHKTKDIVTYGERLNLFVIFKASVIVI
jgi:hypothetical protein